MPITFSSFEAVLKTFRNLSDMYPQKFGWLCRKNEKKKIRLIRLISSQAYRPPELKDVTVIVEFKRISVIEKENPIHFET